MSRFVLTADNIYIAIFLAVALAYLAYIIYRQTAAKKHSTEHSVDEYQARMEVMKVFDLVLQRKPTPEEIAKYSQFENEQDILIHILKDFKSTTNAGSKAIIEEENPSLTKSLSSVTTAEEESHHPRHAKEHVKDEFNDAAQQHQQIQKDGVHEHFGGDDKICLNKHFVLQILDDLQAKIDSVRIMVG